ncbi:MAG: TonB-dependent receptor [Sphingobium sp.]
MTYSKSNTNGSFPKVALANSTGPLATFINRQIAATSGDYYAVSNGHPNPFQKIEQWQIINTTTWKASDTLTIKNIASYAEFRQAVAVNNNGDNFLPGFAAVSLYPDNGKNNVAQSTFTEELQAQGRSADDRLTYQVGAYLELSEPLDGTQSSRSAIFATCGDVFNPATCASTSSQLALSRSRYHFRNLGVYAQSSYKITDQLSFTAGIRYTSDITSGLGNSARVTFGTGTPVYECSQPVNALDNPVANSSAAIQANPSLCNYSRRVSSNKPTWLLGLDFKPVEDVLVYAKYARGYRQGSVNVSNYGLETWGPEKVDTYEIGAKTSFDSFVKGNFNVAAFYNDFSNQQLLAQAVQCGTADVAAGDPRCPFVTSPGQGIANAGKSTIKGVEIDASIRPFQGFSIDVGYAYLDTKLKSVSAPAVPIGFKDVIVPSAGSVLPLTPKNKYSVTGSYTLPLSDDIGRITFSGTFTHQDSSLGQPSSAPSLMFLPPQDNLNLNVNWTSVAGSPVDLGFFATNVTKEKYFVFTTGGYANYGFDSIVLNQPRMYGVRLKYRFGN